MFEKKKTSKPHPTNKISLAAATNSTTFTANIILIDFIYIFYFNIPIHILVTL